MKHLYSKKRRGLWLPLLFMVMVLGWSENAKAQCYGDPIYHEASETIETVTIPSGAIGVRVQARGGDGGDRKRTFAIGPVVVNMETIKGGRAAFIDTEVPIPTGATTIDFIVGEAGKHSIRTDGPGILGSIGAAGGGGGSYVSFGDLSVSSPALSDLIVVAGGGGGAASTIGKGSNILESTISSGGLAGMPGIPIDIDGGGMDDGFGGGAGAGAGASGMMGLGISDPTRPTSPVAGGGLGGTAFGAGGINPPLTQLLATGGIAIDIAGANGGFGGGGAGGGTAFFPSITDVFGGGGGGGGFSGGDGGSISSTAGTQSSGGGAGTSYSMNVPTARVMGANGAGIGSDGYVSLQFIFPATVSLDCPDNNNVMLIATAPECTAQLAELDVPIIMGTDFCTGTGSGVGAAPVDGTWGYILEDATTETGLNRAQLLEIDFPEGEHTFIFASAEGTETCPFNLTVTDASFIEVPCPADLNLTIGNGCTISPNLALDPAVPSCTSSTLSEVLEVRDTNANILLPITNLTELNAYAFSAGGYKVKRIVTDDLGLMETCEFVIGVTGGNSGLSVSCPSDIEIIMDAPTCTAFLDTDFIFDPPTAPCSLPNYTETITVTDTLGFPFPITNLTELLAFDFNGQLYKATFIVNRKITTAAGEMDICSFKVNVKDISSIIVPCPTDIELVIPANSCTITPVDVVFDPATPSCVSNNLMESVVVTDEEENILTPTTLAALNNFPFSAGVYTVKRVVTDGSDAMKMCSFMITVTGGTATDVSCPADFSIVADANCTAMIGALDLDDPITCPSVTILADTFLVTNANGTVLPITNLSDLENFPFASPGAYNIKRIIHDDADGMAMCAFTLMVTGGSTIHIDCPTIPNPFPIGLNCETTLPDLGFSIPTASCNGTVLTDTFLVTDAANNVLPITTETDLLNYVLTPGNYTIKRMIHDDLNEMAMCEFEVMIIDNIAPELSPPADITVSTPEDKCDTLVTNLSPINVLENCMVRDTIWKVTFPDGITMQTGTGDVSSQVNFPLGVSTIEYTVTDTADLMSSPVISTVTVVDAIKPICELLNGGQYDFVLDNSGMAVLDLAFIKNSIIDQSNSSDNCGISFMDNTIYRLIDGNGQTGLGMTGTGLDLKNGAGEPQVTLTCDDLVNSPIDFTLFITDKEGNESIGCPFIVDLAAPPPVGDCKNFIASIGASSTVVVDIASVHDISATACREVELVYFETIPGERETTLTFDCNQVGENTVNVIILDQAGQTDTCEAQITITDPTNQCIAIDFVFETDVDPNLNGSQVYNCQRQCITATVSDLEDNGIDNQNLEIIIERNGNTIFQDDFDTPTDGSGQAQYCFENTDQIIGDVQVTVRCKTPLQVGR